MELCNPKGGTRIFFCKGKWEARIFCTSAIQRGANFLCALTAWKKRRLGCLFWAIFGLSRGVEGLFLALFWPSRGLEACFWPFWAYLRAFWTYWGCWRPVLDPFPPIQGVRSLFWDLLGHIQGVGGMFWYFWALLKAQSGACFEPFGLIRRSSAGAEGLANPIRWGLFWTPFVNIKSGWMPVLGTRPYLVLLGQHCWRLLFWLNISVDSCKYIIF